MSRQENDREQKTAGEDQPEIDSEELSERISEALEPALSDVSLRVAEAVTQSLSKQQQAAAHKAAAEPSPPPDVEEPTPSEDGSSEQRSEADTLDEPTDEQTAPPEDDSPDDRSMLRKATGAVSSALSTGTSGKKPATSGSSRAKAADGDSSSERSILGRASSSLLSSFTDALQEEGGDQLESLVDDLIDMLCRPGARSWVRRLADETLQATLYDVLGMIEDPARRSELYWDTLNRFRPIVREAVDSMYTEESREILRRHAHEAAPDVMHGEFRSAAEHVRRAFSEITNSAEAVFWQHKLDALHTVQQVSTALIQEAIEHAVEDRFDPEEIQEKMQNKVEEAREKLKEKVGDLQEGAHSVQDRLSDKRGGPSSRGRPGTAPAGGPPSGQPPFGEPPSGKPPSGMPPSGKPPSGVPPKGIPPAVERRMKANPSRDGRSRRRR